MKTRMIATVKYNVATYTGEIKVNCFSNDSDEHIIAKAKNKLNNQSNLPFGYQSWKITERYYFSS